MRTPFFPLYKKMLLLLLVAAACLQVACKKDGSNASPVVDQVHPLDSTKRDSFLKSAAPGARLVIKGHGFSGLLAVFFSEVPADINTALSSDENIIVQIPYDLFVRIPNLELVNKIRVVTTHGETTYDFSYLAPSPSLTGMSNENAYAGQEVTLTGSSFFLVSAIIWPGNITDTSFKVNKDASQITTQVPLNVTDTGRIQVIGKFGTGVSTFVFDNYKKPGAGYLANFEDGPFFGWQYFAGEKLNDATLFPNNTGTYIRLRNVGGSISAGDNAWYVNYRSVNVAEGPWVSNSSELLSNYAVKFEMYVKQPWTYGSLQLTTAAANSDGSFKYMARYLPPNSAYTTNGWVTVTLPLTQFQTGLYNSYDQNGKPALNFTDLLGGDGTKSYLRIMLYSDAKMPIEKFDAAFDNVRVVKIN